MQLVRAALGKKKLLRGVNVSSCKFIVTLHGMVEDEGEREAVEAAVRSVTGVAGVVGKLRCNEKHYAS